VRRAIPVKFQHERYDLGQTHRPAAWRQYAE
jgi:hypothetical protein